MNNLRILVERNVELTLRDGTRTSCDVYRPDVDAPVPAVLHRTPYNKGYPAVASTVLDPMRAAAVGLASVVQDVRGRYSSDGSFDPYFQEIDDGFDSVEWCAAQDWCSGDVGMIGASYAGISQLLAAAARPPHLRCIVPILASSDMYEGWTYEGGVLQWGFMVAWVLPMLASEGAEGAGLAEKLRQSVDVLKTTWQLDSPADLPFASELAPYFLDWVAHPQRDDYWRRVGIQDRYGDIDVPSLHVGGWYDIFAAGTVRNFQGLAAGDQPARLIMGAWAHAAPMPTMVGTVDFGLGSGQYPTPIAYDLEADYLTFLRHWLLGADAPEGPPVQFFSMGDNEWRRAATWPPPGVQEASYFLRSSGHANTASGDGILSLEPGEDETPDHFLFDPTDPVPTTGGNLCCFPTQLPSGPFDQASVETRRDVLVYRGDPLTEDVEVTGNVSVEIWLATDCEDTDVTAKLVDIGPCGAVRNIADSILRGQYRDGTDASRPLTPGEPGLWRFELGPTSNKFRAGHRIGLEISSSNFPRFERNRNSLNGSIRVAHQMVFHDSRHRSRVVLPIVQTTREGDAE